MEAMALSPTIAHILLTRSPYHAWQHHRLGGNMRSQSTEATRRGNLIESLLIGGDKDIVVIDAPDFRTKAAQQARDAAEIAGKVPVLADKWAEYDKQAKALRARMDSELLAALARSERTTLEWVSDGVLCKGKTDLLSRQDFSILDLKTCEDASARAVAASVAKYGGDIQAAAYLEGAAVTNPGTDGRWTFRLVHVEPDYGTVSVRNLSGMFMEVGRRKWAKAKRIWRTCLEHDAWPAYDNDIIECPPWMLTDTMEETT